MDVFEAVAEPSRRALLDALIDGERTAGELVATLPGLTQPTVSRHLRVLREVGLVEVRPDAQRRIYALRADGLVAIDEWIDRYRRYWADHLDALERHLERKHKETTMTERDGRLTVDGDRAVLNFERRLPFPIEVVWSAITDPDERAQWFGETTIDAREGGTIEMVATGPPLPPERKRMTGRILVWDPPHCPRTRMEAADRRGRRRALRTAPPTATARCCASPTAGSACATRAGSSAARSLPRPLEAYLTGDALPDWTSAPPEVNQSTERKRTRMTHNGSDIAAPALAIAYHSGFGHTAALADAVADGRHARQAPT